MGVDLVAAIEHTFTAQELLELPALLDSQTGLKAKKFSAGDPYNRQYNKARYTGDFIMTASILENIWEEWEKNTAAAGEHAFDNQVECFIGQVDVWRHTLLVQHFPEHKYANLEDPVKAGIILECNRMIARLTGSGKVLYFPDSAFPTSLLLDKANEGFTLGKLIEYGKNKFGPPPESLVEGMRNMFFIDDFTQDCSTLKDWDLSE